MVLRCYIYRGPFMSYFLKKTKPSKKGEYLQIYETNYVPGKGNRNHSYKALGYVCDLKSQNIADPYKYAQDLIDELNQNKKPRKQIGETSANKNVGHFLMNRMYDYLEVENDLKICLSRKNFQYDPNELLRALISVQTVNPGSKYKAYEQSLPSLFSVNTVYSYDQILDYIETIGSDYQKFIELFNAKIEKKFGRKYDNAYFDCTNYYFEIDTEKGERKKGPSKENRKSPIIGQALMLDSDCIPLAMSLYPGNESEKPYLRKTIEDLKSRFTIEGKIVQVADKGLNCGANIYAAVKEAKDGYIFSKSIHGKGLSQEEKVRVLLEDNNANLRTYVKDKDGKLLYKYKSCTDEFTYYRVSGDPKTAFKVSEKRVVTFNPSLARKKRIEINKLVEKAKSISTIKKAKKEEYGDSVKYVNFESANENGEKVEVYASLNEEKINDDLKYAGYNLLVTSEIKKSADEIYKIYHNLRKIENSFRITKTYLEARPVYLQKTESIHGHFLICYLALTLLRLLEIKVFKDELSAEELISFIRNYSVTEGENETFINNASSDYIYKKVKEKLCLSNLGNLYPKKKELDKIMSCELII